MITNSGGGFSSESAYIFRNLSLWNGSRWVLKNLNLEIPIGSVSVLLGANGAGKSSFLKLLAGVLSRPWQFSGRFDLQNKSVVQLTVGWLSQQMPVNEDMSVKEFLNLSPQPGLMLDGSTFLRDFALEELLTHRLSSLSGGQWQRVRLVQVLSRPCEVLLLDEPDTGLDARWRSVLWRVLSEKRRSGITIIIAAHRFTEIEALASHWFGLEAGELVFSWSQPGGFPQAFVDRLFLGKVLDSQNLLG